MMHVNQIIRFLLFILSPLTSQRVPYTTFNKWMVVASNSSGQLFFDPSPLAPRVFVWKTYNASVKPWFFYDRPPKIVQDPHMTTTSGTITTVVPSTRRSSAPEALEAIAQETSTASFPRVSATNSPRPAQAAALEVSNTTEPMEVSKGLGANLLSHASKMAKMMEILNDQRKAPKLIAPHRESKPFNVTKASNDTIVYAIDEASLTKESSHLNHISREQLRARQQVTPDITTELELSNAQLNNLKAHVNRRFLIGYDCSNP